ncbi:TPM domain-containing protein [Candidatus Bathyarchaeota archaeon]|nr:TPM domain-containing protein [Candidatus Bathyarchaeota archaeon]
MLPKRAATIFFIILLLSTYFLVFSCKAQVVDYDWVEAIESYCIGVDVNTTAEIVVCVFPSLYGHGIKDSSGNEINDIVMLGVHLFNDEPLEVYDGEQTGIGKSGKDNGVLLLVAIEEREYRFEVGYGLEGDLTDIETNLIAQEYLVPAFQEGNYGEGLYGTIVVLGEQIPTSNQTLPVRGYYYYESDAEATEPDSVPFWLIDFYGMPLWLIIILAILGVVGAGFGGGAVRGGRSGGGGSGGKW